MSYIGRFLSYRTAQILIFFLPFLEFFFGGGEGLLFFFFFFLFVCVLLNCSQFDFSWPLYESHNKNPLHFRISGVSIGCSSCIKIWLKVNRFTKVFW